jgi:RNA polymerase sigma-70 factor (ECF subfamily)
VKSLEQTCRDRGRIRLQIKIATANRLAGRQRLYLGACRRPNLEVVVSVETSRPDLLNQLMEQLRPQLHRYCARMVGSAFEAEDVVQEALAKAVQAFPRAGAVERLDSWLFRIAHNSAVDALRQRKRLAETELLPDDLDFGDVSSGADSLVTAAASLQTLMQLPVVQRSSVVLIDVLEHSLEEAAEILNTSLPAVKSALRRGRVRLQALATEQAEAPQVLSTDEIERLRAYAERFNARDFDSLRALLAEDVELDLVNRRRLSGYKDVGVYFTRYAGRSDWHFSVGLAEGMPALLVRNPENASGRIENVVLLAWTRGEISAIRDFFYAPYVVDSLSITVV